MALFEIRHDNLRAIPEASFSEIKVREREDLQRLLRSQIDVIGDDLYVLTEEFGEWEDSRRRIDLLAIDRQANLVVIELKRTVDGGHMELQAIRYASMVSAMTFDRAEQIHAEFLTRNGLPGASRDRLLEFLGWDEANDGFFARDVRIILVSEDFGKELTTAVLWLNQRDLDIRCIRLRPFKDGDVRLVDVQQIIPLPEIAEYQVQLKQKGQVERRIREVVNDVRLRFWRGIVALARERNTRHANRKPGVYHWLGASSGIRGLNFNYVVTQGVGIAELYIDRGKVEENKDIFDRLAERKSEVERQFGAQLSWERLDARRASRIKFVIERGGYSSPEEEWPALQAEMVDAMVRLEAALMPVLLGLEI